MLFKRDAEGERDCRDGSWLRALPALPEVPSLAPSTHIRCLKLVVIPATGDLTRDQ